MSHLPIRILFVISGLYDFAIGLTFLLAGTRLFESTGVPLPNHWAYIEFGCLQLMIFGLMFFVIAYDPVQFCHMIPFGMLLKLSYTGLCTYYWLTSDCPWLFKPFAVIDGIMFLLFVVAYVRLRK